MSNYIVWTEAERAFVRDNTGKMPVREMAKVLQHSPSSVMAEIRRMRASGEEIAPSASRRVFAGTKLWTPERLAYLKEHREDSDEDVAAVLGCAPSSVARQREIFRHQEQREYYRRAQREARAQQLALRKAMMTVRPGDRVRVPDDDLRMVEAVVLWVHPKARYVLVRRGITRVCYWPEEVLRR